MSFAVAVRRQLHGFTLDVTFDAPAGVTVLVGPSGAGKTLTLRAVAGLLRLDAGRVVCAGRVLVDTAAGVELPARLRRVGYVFQQYALFPHLTVAQNVAYGLHDRAPAERAARVAALLDAVDLAAYARRLPGELSGGEQQRVALARALAPEPVALLLDEPFAAVDAPLRSRLRGELRALHERLRVPMLLVTHDPADAAELAHRAIVLDRGRVTAAGGVGELFPP